MRRLICLAFAWLLVLGACTEGDGSDPNTASVSRFRQPDFAAGSVLFLRDTSLTLFDSASGDEKEIAELKSAEAVASPDGALVAYVASRGSEEEDFIEDPELRLLEVASGDSIEVGAGRAPSFSPSGDLLAYVQPVGARKCEGEVCSGDSRVMAGVPGEQAREIVGPGRWISLGWVGERLMLVDQADPTGVKLVSPETDPVDIDIAPGGIWGGSPDGDQVLLISANAAEFRSIDEEGLEQESTLVALNGSLGQGAWSPDGSIVAAVLLGAPEGGIPNTELVTIAAEESAGSRVEIVPKSVGAAGQVVWSVDGESLVYVKSAPPRDLNLQAILCERPPEGRCKSLFTWKRGVTLLHLY